MNATVVEVDDVREALTYWRNELAATHLITKYDNSHIRLIRVVDTAETPVDGEPIEVDLTQDMHTAARLIELAVATHVSSVGRTVIDTSPAKYLADIEKFNLMHEVNPQVPGWLAIALSYIVACRPIEAPGGTRSLQLLADVDTHPLIAKSCADLAKSGIDTTGMYVARRDASGQRLVGRVSQVSGTEVTVSGAATEAVSISGEELYPEPSLANLKRLVAASTKDSADEFVSRYLTVTGTHLSGPSRLKRVRQTLQYFAGQNLQLVPGVTATMGALLTETDPEFPVAVVSEPPVYVMGRSTTDTLPKRGLSRHGPYSRQSFTPTTPAVCVICSDRHRGKVEQFINKMKNGIALEGRPAYSHFPGLVRLYGLQDLKVHFFEANSDSFDSYTSACRKALEAQSELAVSWSLALVQVERRFRDRPVTEDPYWAAKVALMGAGVPVQEFLVENIVGPDSVVIYTAENLALASYAKMGGIPWLLSRPQTVAHELVIGMESSYFGSSRLQRNQRQVGISTVFGGDGMYWVSETTTAVPYEELSSALVESTMGAVKRISSDMNWQRNEDVRLVFHSFKPFRDDEITAIESSMSTLCDHAQFAYLHVKRQHPYLLFDQSQPGMAYGRSKKAELVPNRGTIVQLNRHAALVAMIGPREIKKASQGLPRPLLLDLHPRSTFRDMRYLAEQVAAFGAHSWRGFLPAPEPVTLQYSGLVARLLGRMSMIPSWNPSAMFAPLGNKRWFL